MGEEPTKLWDEAEFIAAFPVLIAWQMLESKSRLLRELLAKQSGLGFSDFQALLRVSLTDETSPQDISHHLGISSGATTALIDRLEAAGMASRVAVQGDRRRQKILLTDHGRDIARATADRYLSAINNAVDSGEAARIESFLRRMSRALTPE